MNVLIPLTKKELEYFFDLNSQKVINFFINKSLFSQPELVNKQKKLPIQIPKEHLEQWIVQALNVKPIGAGSYPVDVVGVNWAADIKMISCKLDKNGDLTNGDSGETSLAQKFSDSIFGKTTLDNLFKEEKYEFILDKWLEIFKEKYDILVKDYPNVKSTYYFIVLRAGSKFYLTGLKVELNNLENVTLDKKRTTSKSIFENGFIDKKYGYCKIYKSKKRLELRLKPKKWVEEERVLTFDTEFKLNETNIKEIVKNNNLKKYVKELINKIFDINLE